MRSSADGGEGDTGGDREPDDEPDASAGTEFDVPSLNSGLASGCVISGESTFTEYSECSELCIMASNRGGSTPRPGRLCSARTAAFHQFSSSSSSVPSIGTFLEARFDLQST